MLTTRVDARVYNRPFPAHSDMMQEGCFVTCTNDSLTSVCLPSAEFLVIPCTTHLLRRIFRREKIRLIGWRTLVQPLYLSQQRRADSNRCLYAHTDRKSHNVTLNHSVLVCTLPGLHLGSRHLEGGSFREAVLGFGQSPERI